MKVPYKVWREGLDKWEEGAAKTDDNKEWIGWMFAIGKRPCSFCRHFNGGGFCEAEECPLWNNGECAPEYSTAAIAYSNNDFPAFHAAAVALRDRIVALDHEES